MNPKSATLLIVDDEEGIRDLMRRHFSFQGYQVLTASDGDEALMILSEKKVDVVISDIMMPNMDGTELIQRIRAEYPIMRVIMMTGYVSMSNLLICLQNQADTVIFKPFKNLDEIDEAVARALVHLDHWKRKLLELQGLKGV
jgi:CheY-like chemotaxis protein